jgi:hypothetical protein
MVESAPPRHRGPLVFPLFFLLSSHFFALRKSSNFEFPARIKKGGGKTHWTP